MKLQSTTTLPRSSSTEWRVYVPIAVWLVAMSASWVWMQRYEFGTNAPLAQRVVAHWPEDSQLVKIVDCPTLLLFLNPKCPCSRATLFELERLLTSTVEAVPIDYDLIVVATVPIGADDTWLQTDTVRRAATLKRARLIVDQDGVEAARFGATTSGMVMLFDNNGVRQYAGGITICRAHEGDNVGRDGVGEILLGRSGRVPEIPAFGCQLCLPEPPGEFTTRAVTPSIRSTHEFTEPRSGTT
jgi:hypothetical protein